MRHLGKMIIWQLDITKRRCFLRRSEERKAGNIISPNPNTIAVSEAFKVDLTSLMMKNFIPATVQSL